MVEHAGSLSIRVVYLTDIFKIVRTDRFVFIVNYKIKMLSNLFLEACLLFVVVVCEKQVRLSPIKCAGKVSVSRNSAWSKDAVFLSRSNRLEVVDNNELTNSVTICDVVPIIVERTPILPNGLIKSHFHEIL